MEDIKKDLRNKYYIHCDDRLSDWYSGLIFLGADNLKVVWANDNGTVTKGANLIVTQYGDVQKISDAFVRELQLKELTTDVMIELLSKNTPCEETETDTEELKKDADKPKFHLLPLQDLEDIVRVYEFGCKKYSENSWRKIEATTENKNRIASALLRHLAEWQEKNVNGEKAIDEESGLPTIAHVAWNAIMLVHLERETDK